MLVIWFTLAQQNPFEYGTLADLVGVNTDEAIIEDFEKLAAPMRFWHMPICALGGIAIIQSTIQFKCVSATEVYAI